MSVADVQQRRQVFQSDETIADVRKFVLEVCKPAFGCSFHDSERKGLAWKMAGGLGEKRPCMEDGWWMASKINIATGVVDGRLPITVI